MRKYLLLALAAILMISFGSAAALAQPAPKPPYSDRTPEPETGDAATPTPSALNPPLRPTPAEPAGSPVAVAPRLDLAAMSLDAASLPDGYQLFYKVYTPGSEISANLTGGLLPQADVDATGLQWFYESVYMTADGSTRIRSYIEQYPSADDAVKGFDLLEDESLLAPEGSSFTDLPGAGVGEAPSEISEGSLAPSGTPMEITSVDSTFRVGNLIAGTAVDTMPGTTADRQLAIDLSKTLYDRIEAVLANQPLPMIDYALPGQMLSLGPDWRGRDEGYIEGTALFGPDLMAQFQSSFISAYFTNQTMVSTNTATLPIPIVSITTAKFQDESAPLGLLDQLATFQPQFLDMHSVDIDPIPGASVTLAFEYANPFLSEAEVDSVRIMTVVGGSLVILDIQGNKTVDGALEAGIQIATAQAACLKSTSPCSPLQLPEGLLVAPPATLPGDSAVG